MGRKQLVVLALAVVLLFSTIGQAPASGVETIIIKVGDGPNEVAVNPDTNMVYVINQRSDSLSVIDGSTNNVVKTIDVGDFPAGVAVNPNTNMVYVTNLHSDSLSVIDGSTNNVVKTIRVGEIPEGVAVNPNTNMVYVVRYLEGKVIVIDGSTNNIMETIDVGDRPTWNVAVNPDTNMVYVTNLYSNSLSVIDGSTNNVVKTIDVGDFPAGVAVNPDTNMVYVTNHNSDSLSVIDGMTVEEPLVDKPKIIDQEPSVSTKEKAEEEVTPSIPVCGVNEVLENGKCVTVKEDLDYLIIIGVAAAVAAAIAIFFLIKKRLPKEIMPQDVNRCGNCQTVNSSTSKFCKKCGSYLTRLTETY